jgi:signal transduction histidine kinase
MQFQELHTVRRRPVAPDDLAAVIAGDDRARNLEIILNVTKMITHSLILDEVLGLVLDNSIRVARAERGFLLLADDEGTLSCVMSHDASGEPLESDQTAFSRTVVDDVFSSGESVCVENAQLDDLYDRRESVRSLELETILCSPLTVRDEKIGVLYVDSRHIQPVHREEIISLFEILAGQAAIAIKNAQLYERLRTAFEELESLNERFIIFERLATKGEMAAEVSHELNNLLSVVSFHLSSFKRGMKRFTKAEIEERLEKISSAVKRISQFSLGLAEASHLDAKPLPGDVNTCVQETIRFVQPLQKFRGANIVTAFADPLPIVSFDRQQLQQVVLNLLTNAVEARRDARIDVVTASDASTGNVFLTVRDNGPGISREVQEKLFREKVTTKPTGHGYGLPVCRKIIEHTGGTITMRSDPGAGAEFLISMPINAMTAPGTQDR